MGPETVKTSAKSKRAAKAIADLRKGDDKQTRKAAETVTRVIPKFNSYYRGVSGYIKLGGQIKENNILSIFFTQDSVFRFLGESRTPYIALEISSILPKIKILGAVLELPAK